MNDKQKKIIMIFTILILFLASAGAITLLIIGYVSKDEILKLVGTITTIISPSMLLGIAIKILINNIFHKSIKKTLNNAGIKDIEPKSKEVKKNIAIYKYGSYIFIEKENTLIIKMPTNRIETLSELNGLKDTMPYYIGQKRKEIQMKESTK